MDMVTLKRCASLLVVGLAEGAQHDVHLDVLLKPRQHGRQVGEHDLCPQRRSGQTDHTDAGSDFNQALTCERLSACIWDAIYVKVKAAPFNFPASSGMFITFIMCI